LWQVTQLASKIGFSLVVYVEVVEPQSLVVTAAFLHAEMVTTTAKMLERIIFFIVMVFLTNACTCK
jgi:hypothetical protein